MDRHRELTALIAENDAGVQGVIRVILERLGFEVLLAGSGVVGVQRCEEIQGELALVVADIVMPEMGGVPMVRKIRASWPEMPVLYMSGYPEFDDFLEDDPITSFVAKPFDVRSFSEAVIALVPRCNDAAAA